MFDIFSIFLLKLEIHSEDILKTKFNQLDFLLIEYYIFGINCQIRSKNSNSIKRLRLNWMVTEIMVRKRIVLLWTPTYGRAKAAWPARTYIQQLWEDTGCNPEDLPEVMNDREKGRERVRDIRTSGTTSWWWSVKLLNRILSVYKYCINSAYVLYKGSIFTAF